MTLSGPFPLHLYIKQVAILWLTLLFTALFWNGYLSRSQALLTRLRLHDLKCLLHCFSKKTVDAFAVEKLTSTAKIKVVKQFTVVQLLAGSGSTPTITSAKLASRKLNAVSLVPRRCNRSWPLGASPSLPGTA